MRADPTRLRRADPASGMSHESGSLELLTHLCHEFRTPLTLILGPLRDLERGCCGDLPGAALDQISLARRNGERILALVESTLDAARLESGRLTLAVRRDDLVAFLRNLGAALQPLASRRRLTLRVDLPDGPVPMWFDPEQLRRVVGNLLSNAMKFTPAGGEVLLSAETVEGSNRVVVRVADTGSGIPADLHERIFERFYRVDDSATRRHPGTGIGLALARELADLHRATLEVESSDATGSTFTLGLRNGHAHFPAEWLEAGAAQPNARHADPAVASPPTAASRPVPRRTAAHRSLRSSPHRPHPQPGAADGRPLVLVVEDRADLRAYIRGHLEEGHRVEEAADGAQGLARAKATLPDLVVSDVLMPGLEGFELCRALRAEPALQAIPILLLTVEGSLGSRLRALRCGVDSFLTKPFEPRELVATAESLIAARRRRDRFAGLATLRPPLALAPAAANGRRVTAADRDFLVRVAGTVDEMLADQNLTVDALARRIAVDRTHLYRRLRALTGLSPSQLLIERRLARSAQLLAAGTRSVTEVGFAVGFKSISHFSRRFLARFGVAPSAYGRPTGRA